MFFKKRMLSAALCSAFLLVGCGDKEEVIKEENVKEEIEVIPVVEEEVYSYVTPFTGELVSEEVTMRPVIATINNHPDARPQSGIASADVIYEMLAEGDITRLLALYQSDIPDSIGPIRSARDYFLEIAQGLDAFYIAHGYSPEAQVMLMNGFVDNINGMQYDGTIFQRSTDRVAPHNSYITGENISLGAEKVHASLLYQDKVSYSYYNEDESAKIGVQTNQVSVRYSNYDAFNSQYTYDIQTNTYSRSAGNEVTVDALTDEPLAISNVLFFEMDHQIIDNAGRRAINLTSGGKAYLFQEGMMREVQWENIDGVLKAVEADGSEVKLIPGQTWISFVPSNPGIATSVQYTQQS